MRTRLEWRCEGSVSEYQTPLDLIPLDNFPIPKELQETGTMLRINDWGFHWLTPVAPIDPNHTQAYRLEFVEVTDQFPELILSFDKRNQIPNQVNNRLAQVRPTHYPFVFRFTDMEWHCSFDLRFPDGDVFDTFFRFGYHDDENGLLHVRSHNFSLSLPVLGPELSIIPVERLAKLADVYEFAGEPLTTISGEDLFRCQRVHFHYAVSQDSKKIELFHFWMTDGDENAILINGYSPEEYVTAIKGLKRKPGVTGIERILI